jgi:hypothetical protein
MADQQDDGFSKELATAFAEGMVENQSAPQVEEAQIPDPTTPPANVEEPKKDEPDTPDVPDQKEDPVAAPADSSEQKEENPSQSEDPEAPAQEESAPLTEASIRKIMGDMRNEERSSSQMMQNTYKEVLDSYYPDGLSDVLVDQSTGKELRTPQDVVDAAGGDMSMEEAARWLMNEQYQLEQSLKNIRNQATQVAETTVNFRRDSMAALEKYEPLFNTYPRLQQKAFNLMMRQVKADESKGVILEAPDVMDLYDTYLEPYQKAYEYSTNQPATNPVSTPPAPATPGQADRFDEGGDGGASPVDDPNDFAQQVNKELAKGI